MGLLLALLAVGSMTLLQVDQSYAAAQVHTTRVKVILSRAQLAVLAQQNHALYVQVIKAYQTGSPLTVTQLEYRVLSRLSAAYLGSAKAGQPAPSAPGSPQNPITPGPKATPTPTFPVPTSGPLVPWIQGMAQLAADLAAGTTLFPAFGCGIDGCLRHRTGADRDQRYPHAAFAGGDRVEVAKPSEECQRSRPG